MHAQDQQVGEKVMSKKRSAIAGTLAGAMLFLLSNPAQAAVITFNTPIAIPATLDGLYINFATGRVGYSDAAPPLGWDFNAYQSSANSLVFFWNVGNGGVTDSPSIYQNLAPGSEISSTSSFGALQSGASTSQFKSVGDHILGFRFFNESTGATNYGNLTMTNGGGSGFPATITGWSYEDTGAAITVASAVPEPATWAMMIIGFGAVGSKVRTSRGRNVFGAA